ncbi:hypothetical protein SUGI_0339280 [Cryptomeria japonica]|nr:hypothetical protein SUGI_0339280 [Cryptomeria japonica]
MGNYSFPSFCCFSSSSTAEEVFASQHNTIAGPSTTVESDFQSFLHKFNDISQLNDLIQYIEKLLDNKSDKKSEEASISPFIKDGQTLLETVEKHIDRLHDKQDFKDAVSAETEKVVMNFLKGAGKLHWVVAALSVVGFALERYNQMSKNYQECLELLKDMFNLAKHIVWLNDQMPEQKHKLNEAVQCIVVGCTMCVSQSTRTEFFRFLTASVNAEKSRQSKIAPQLQEFYAYQERVGIQSGLESVIQLLDLNAQDALPIVVVVYGLGGIGKTTLADAVYAQIDLKTYKHCRIHMDQNCTKKDLKALQQQILYGLFQQNVELTDCDKDLKQLLPEDLGSCLPPRSRMLVTTRNLHETDTFNARNIQRQQYRVSSLPQTHARKILLKKATEYNDEKNIHDLLELCGGVPLLLEIAGSQLAISSRNTINIVLELLREVEKVEEEDISDRMIDFVYHRLLPPVKEAFLDITSFFHDWPSQKVAYIVGEEEFRALEEASFIKKSQMGTVIVHDIVRARGKKMSEQNRIRDPETLLKCLKDEEKLKNLKGILLYEEYEQPPIEINENHLNCMSNSVRVLSYEGSQIIFRGKCNKSFKQLRNLGIPSNVANLPMEFEKLGRPARYRGPFTQGMSLHELPPSLLALHFTGSSKNAVENSKLPPEVTSSSSVVKLGFSDLKNMQRLPDGLEKLSKLEELYLIDCHQLRELPSKLGDLSNLKRLWLDQCHELKELPSDFGQLSNLTSLYLSGCSSLCVLPSSFAHLISLKQLFLDYCTSLKKLPSNFGQLKNLEELDLSHCSGLGEWPLSFRGLTKMKNSGSNLTLPNF